MLDKIANKIIIFTDGAAKGNPGPGGWGSIIATIDAKVIELGGAARLVTNNQMEMLAVIEALKYIRRLDGRVSVFTDSTYVINGITGWVFGWKKRGWRKASGEQIANLELWQQLLELVQERPAKSIEWHYVRGHIGTPGNERADEIASSLAQKIKIDLYDGPLLKYDIAIHDVPDDTSLPEERKKSSKSSRSKTPYCYLSLIGGEIIEHQTWKDCEARVKGRSGAKFKKAMTPSDVEKIKKDWGY